MQEFILIVLIVLSLISILNCFTIVDHTILINKNIQNIEDIVDRINNIEKKIIELHPNSKLNYYGT